MGAAAVVVDRVALQLGGLLRVGRGALLGEVDDRIGLLVHEELQENVVLLLDVDEVEGNLLAGDLLPGGDAGLGAGDRGERVAAELEVDLATGKVVDDDDVVTLLREVEGGGQPQKPSPPRTMTFFLLPVGSMGYS